MCEFRRKNATHNAPGGILAPAGVYEQDIKQFELSKGSLEAPGKKDEDNDGFHIKAGLKVLLGIDIDISFSMKKNQ